MVKGTKQGLIIVRTSNPCKFSPPMFHLVTLISSCFNLKKISLLKILSATQEDKYFTTNKIYTKIFNSKNISNYGRCEHCVERRFRTLEGKHFRGGKVRFIGQFYNSLLMMLSSLSWHDHFLNCFL